MTRVRVLMDASALIYGHGGVARYAAQLYSHLTDASVSVRRFALGRGITRAPADVRRLRVPARVLRRFWSRVPYPPIERLFGPADVLHVLDLVPPPSRLPTVLTVQDLDAVLRPDLHDPRATALQRAQLEAARTVTVVLAISHATADALAARGIDRDRIVVTQLGLTPLPAPMPFAIDGDQPFVLGVGSPSPRRGFATLLQALRHVPDLRVVFAGRGWKDYDHPDLDPVRARVVVADGIDDAQLAWLYENATALCFPSLAEGFGLPVLEAMGAGLPVVASDIPVVREVAGDAAVLVPPGDAGALASALAMVIGEQQRRVTMAAAGRTRAAHFTWDRTAATTVAAYRTALEKAS